MKQYLFFFVFSLLCFTSTASKACEITVLSTTDGYNVGSEVTFTTSSAQSYYWLYAGLVTPTSSNTGQTFTVRIDAPGQISVSVTRFVNGTCVACDPIRITGITPAPCELEIQQIIPMNYAEGCGCLFKRGEFRLICPETGEEVRADWEIQQNGANAFHCVSWGCTAPSPSTTPYRESNTNRIKPVPQCNWANTQVTIIAYAHNTNNILASKSFTIGVGACEDPDPFPKSLRLNVEQNELSFNNESDQVYDLEVYDIVSNKKVVSLNDQKLPHGNYVFNLKGKLLHDTFYLVVVKDQSGAIVLKKKISIKD